MYYVICLSQVFVRIFQDFVEELRGKEEELSKISKMADNFRDGSHVCINNS